MREGTTIFCLIRICSTLFLFLSPLDTAFFTVRRGRTLRFNEPECCVTYCEKNQNAALHTVRRTRMLRSFCEKNQNAALHTVRRTRMLRYIL